MIPKQKWVWMPHAAHFICGNACRFHLATYVGSYIVSTVGELWQEQAVRRIHAEVRNPKWFAKNAQLKGDLFDAAYRKAFGFEELGYNRTYETMVFTARKADGKERACCPWVIKNGSEVDMRGYTSAEEAYDGHVRLCEKWSRNTEKKKGVVGE